MLWSVACVCLCLHAALGVKVKVVMHSDEDSKIEDEEPRTEPWSRHKKRLDVTNLPFLKHYKREHGRAEEKFVS